MKEVQNNPDKIDLILDTKKKKAAVYIGSDNYGINRLGKIIESANIDHNFNKPKFVQFALKILKMKVLLFSSSAANFIFAIKIAMNNLLNRVLMSVLFVGKKLISRKFDIVYFNNQL